MKKFLPSLFISGVVFSILGIFGFLQSQRFASLAKTWIAHYLPKQWGIKIDFSEFGLEFFPPGFTIKNPKIELAHKNILNFPFSSKIEAEKIALHFFPFQLFSGDLQVRELKCIQGRFFLTLNAPIQEKKLKKRSFFKKNHEFFRINAEKISIQDFYIFAQSPHTQENLEAYVEDFQIFQKINQENFQVDLKLSKIKGDYLHSYFLPPEIETIEGKAYGNSKELNLNSLSLISSSSAMEMKGKIQGNLLNAKKLPFNTQTKISGDLQKLGQIYLSKKNKSAPAGKLSFNGTLKGDLKNLKKSFKVVGEVNIQQAKYQNWKADQIKIDTEWNSSPQGGELFISQGVIDAQPKPRLNGEAGDGGKVFIGPTRWSIGSKKEINVPIQLEKAHLHWLIPDPHLLKNIYSLDLRFTGKTNLKWIPSSPESSWMCLLDADTLIEEFQFDNQRYQQNKPTSKIFQIPQIHVQGPIQLHAQGITFLNPNIQLPDTQLKVWGNIDYQKGWDLHAAGPSSLKDLGEIAEIPISGEGKINLHVHGQLPKVDVEIGLDIQDAVYLDLNLGHFMGKITWQNDSEFLLFQNFQGRQAATHYQVDGKVDFNEEEKIDLNVQIVEGEMQSLVQVFKSLVSPISWFPSSIEGTMQGKVQISGGLDLKKLEILSHIKGQNWKYRGENLHSVELEGGYHRGLYHISSFLGKKHLTQLQGAISYHAFTQEIDWNLKTNYLMLNHLDYLTQFALPIQGGLEIFSEGKGHLNALDSYTIIQGKNIQLGGELLPPSAFEMITSKNQIQIQAQLNGQQANTQYIRNAQQAEWKMSAKDFDFRPALLLLNTDLLKDPHFKATFSGNVHLHYPINNIQQTSGLILLKDCFLSKTNTQFHLDQPVEFHFKQGQLSPCMATLQEKKVKEKFNIYFNPSNHQFLARMEAHCRLSNLEFLVPFLKFPSNSGQMDIHLLTQGFLKPDITGNAQLKNGTFQFSGLETPFEELNGTIQIQNRQLQFQNMHAKLGGGAVQMNGNILLPAKIKEPIQLHLNGKLKQAKAKFYPFQYAVMDGDIQIVGDQPPYEIGGNVIIQSALWKEKILNQKRDTQLIQYLPPSIQSIQNGKNQFKLNIDLQTRGIKIHNDLFHHVEILGKGHLTHFLSVPFISGEWETIRS